MRKQFAKFFMGVANWFDKKESAKHYDFGFIEAQGYFTSREFLTMINDYSKERSTKLGITATQLAKQALFNAGDNEVLRQEMLKLIVDKTIGDEDGAHYTVNAYRGHLLKAAYFKVIEQERKALHIR